VAGCTPYLLSSGASTRHLGGHDSTHNPHPLHSSTSIVISPRGCDAMFSSQFDSLQLIALKPALFLAILVQLVLELGMGDPDESLGPLPDGLSVQVRDAKFGDDVVYVGAPGQHARAMGQARHDAGYGSLFGRRGQRNNRLAPFRACRSADEIELSAEAAVEPRANRLRADLSGEVNLYGRVDGHHALVLRNAERIVGIGRRMELENRVLVHKVEQLLGAEDEAQDDLSWLEVLAQPVDHTRFNQWDRVVRDQFGMHAKVPAVHQVGQDGIWNAADAALQHRAVFDQRRDMRADRAMEISDLIFLDLAQWARDFHNGVEFADVDETVPVSPRHLRVHLRHHAMRVLGGGKRGLDVHAEAAIAMRIGRRHLDKSDVDRHLAALDEGLDLAQEDRRVVGAASVHRLAYVASDEQGVMAETLRHFGSAIRRRSQREQVNDLHISYVRGALHQGFHQRLGLGAPGVDVHPHARLHTANRLARGHQLASIRINPGHDWALVSRSYRFLKHLIPSLSALVAKRGIVDGAVEKLVEHLQQFHLAEDLCRLLQLSVFLQVVPQVLPHQADHPHNLTGWNALFSTLGADSEITVLDVGLSLAEQPLAEVAIHLVNLGRQFRLGHICVSRTFLVVAIKFMQTAGESIRVGFNQLNQPICEQHV